MSSAIWYLGRDDTGPALTGTLERELTPNAWQAEDLTVATAVTITLYRANGTTYKADAAVDVVDAPLGKVRYRWATADSQQGTLTGKCRVTYADGTKVSFPKPGRFRIQVGH